MCSEVNTQGALSKVASNFRASDKIKSIEGLNDRISLCNWKNLNISAGKLALALLSLLEAVAGAPTKE